MKFLPKLALSGLLALSLQGLTQTTQAQANININPPSWGPAAPAGTQYYYVPEYGGYYDLRDRQYIVQRDGRWTRVTTLSGYSPNNFHPVVINYVGSQPWVLISEHKTKYPKGGHPHGMPPGQAKKMRGASYGGPGVIVVDDRDNDKGHGKGHGKGKGKH